MCRIVVLLIQISFHRAASNEAKFVDHRGCLAAQPFAITDLRIHDKDPTN